VQESAQLKLSLHTRARRFVKYCVKEQARLHGRHRDILEVQDTSRSTHVMSTASAPMYEWKDLPWCKIERRVYKLQKRIYQAMRCGDVKAVHRLQRLITKSWSAKCLAVRRVTQDNQGKRTAGVDGIKALTPPQRLALAKQLNLAAKPRPVRRTWIPKPGTDEKRPLGIATMQDRACKR
jgi:RNA-directed DNA polymerase